MRTTISHAIGWRCLTASTLLLSLGQAAMAGAEESARQLNVPPEGFTALFNGKDFTGWHASPDVLANWAVEDGVLKSHGLVDHWRASLITKKHYRDFILMLEFRMPTISDSGICFRRLIPEIPGFGTMEQFNLRSRGGMGHLESYYFLPKDTAKKVGLKEDEKPHVRHIDPEVGVWHRVKLTMRGRTFSAEYDGEVLYDNFRFHDWMMNMEPAPILLQKHMVVRGDNLGAENPCPIEYRNVFIKELGPGDTASAPLPSRGEGRGEGRQNTRPMDSPNAELLARIDAGDLPEAYVPARHQEYVDRRWPELSPEQSAKVNQLWKEKQAIDPNMPNRGFSFVKIMTYVAEGEKLPAENGGHKKLSADDPAKSGVRTSHERKAAKPVNGWTWSAEKDAEGANRKAIPFEIPEGPTIYVVSFGVSEGDKPPVVLLPESRLSVGGRIATAAPVYFGITINHPNGDFAGRFVTDREADEFSDGEDFAVTFELRDFQLDPSLAVMKDKLPSEPFHFVVESIWFTTLEKKVGLEIAEVKLTAPFGATSSKSKDGDDVGKSEEVNLPPLANAPQGVRNSAIDQANAQGLKHSRGPTDYLSADKQDVDKWREMKFGLFVHWGPISILGEPIGWSRGGERRGWRGKGHVPVAVYDHLYKRFNPVKFNADEWVQMAKDAGMKYLVFVCKHHDGFCMFDSKLTDYKITNSPFKRDIFGELADACQKAGLKLGFYYSLPDWYHVDYRTENHQRYIDYMHGQVRELCSNYGKIDIVWWDGLGGTAKDWDMHNLVRMIRQLQPHVIINSRGGLPGDHQTAEQKVGKPEFNRPWEANMTLGTRWAWIPNDKIKSRRQCIQTLVRVVGGDGNYLLDVGPMADGQIEPRQVARLKEMGQWLRDHGDSIYATRGGPFIPGSWGSSTRRGNTIYLHVLSWPDDTIILPPIPRRILESSVLTGGTAHVKQTDEAIEVSVPQTDRRELDTIIVLQLDGPASEIAPLPLPFSSLTAGKPVKASSTFFDPRPPHADPENAVDDDVFTRWAADAGTQQAWLEVDLGEQTTFNRARISEEFDRVREFELQYKEGREWKTFARGTKIGPDYSSRFQPVSARHVRLNIPNATGGPTIWEFQLFAPSE